MASEPPVIFEQTLERAIELLRREGRVSYQRLKRQFGIDEAFVEDLRVELIDAKRLAADEGGKVLVWNELATAPADGVSQTGPEPALGKENAVRAVQQPAGYTPHHLTHDVFHDPSAIEGERKQVTVLFCDVAGSTELAHRLDAEVMHDVMDRVLRLVGDIVHRFGGTVNQYLGDGLMALFGAPRALEDHAVRAAHSAIAVHEALKRERVLLKANPEIEVKLRIGLSTGMVVVGRLGPDLRMDYTAVGETTNVAARIQEIAEPGSTLITDATRRLVEGHVVLEALGATSIRGEHDQIPVFRLVRPRSHRSRFKVLADRGLTPLIGRGDSLELLRQCLDRARRGRGNAVAIVGDAGVGKSRVVHEFLQAIPAAMATVAIGQCADETKGRPYVPILEWARSLFRIEERDSPPEIREKVIRGTLDLDARLEEASALLADVLAPGADDADSHHLDAIAWRKRMLDAVLAFAEAVAKRQPLVLVVEDLHWIDPSSEQCLTSLAQGLDRLPVLLVTTHRTGKYTIPWSDTDHYTQIGLDVFTVDEARRMMAAMVRERALPSDMPSLVHKKTGGNPLFVEEVMRTWLTRQAPSESQSQTASETSLEIPETVDDILRARVDELDGSVKRMLQAAAAIGPQFSAHLLSQLSDAGPDVTRALDTAVRLGFIQAHRFYPDPQYAFKHSIVQDVVYETLLKPRLRELHGRIGGAMEWLYADNLEEYLIAIAYHFSRSANYPKALTYSIRAGELAERFHARAEAADHYSAALNAARSIEDAEEGKRGQIDAIVKLASVATTGEHAKRDARNLELARAWADELADSRRIAQVAYRRGRLAYDRGDFDEALSFAERSQQLAEELGDERLAAPPLNLVGRVHWQRGDYGKAAQLLVQSTEQMRRLGNRGEEATAAGFAGWTLAFLGERENALDFAERGLRLARELRNPFAEAAARMYFGSVFDQRGDWDKAIDQYDEALRLTTQVGDAFRTYLIRGQMGRALSMRGDLPRAREVLEKAIAFANRVGTTFVLSWMKSYLAVCHLAQRDVAAAKRLGEEALRLAEPRGDKHGRMSALRVLAQALAAEDHPDFDAAVENIRKAIRVEHEMRVKPELGRTYLEYANICRRMKQVEQAEAYLSVARDVFEQQGMRWDLKRAVL